MRSCPRVTAERSAFNLGLGARHWGQAYDFHTMYHPSYETLYDDLPSGTATPAEAGTGWAFPSLFDLGGELSVRATHGYMELDRERLARMHFDHEAAESFFSGKEPFVVGVPEIPPVLAFKLRPSGRPEADHRYGFTPPVASSVAEYGVPTKPLPNAAVEI